MKLTALKLTAFRSFVDFDLPVAHPRPYISGLNGAGKTSIREALRWLLLGRCEYTDAKGQGVELLAPESVRPYRVLVSVTDAGLGAIERTWNGRDSTFIVQGFTGSSKAQQAALLDRWQTDERFIDVCLDSSTFVQLHHAEAKALVLSLLHVTVKLSEDDQETYTLAELDELYDRAFDARRDLKRDLQRFALPVRPEPREFPDLAKAEELMGQLRKAIDERVELIGGNRSTRAHAVQALKRAGDALQVATDRRRQLPEAPDDLDAHIEDLEERLSLMEADATGEGEPLPLASQSRQDDDVRLGVLQVLRKEADALDAHRPPKGCVLNRDVPCKTARSLFERAAKEIRSQIAAGEQTLAAAGQPVPAPPTVNALTELRQKLDGLVRQRLDLVAAVEALEGAQAAQVTAQATIDGLPDLSAAEAEIEGLRARVAKGEGVLAETRTYLAQVKAFEDADGKRRQMQAQLDELEQTVEALGPNGIRVQALGAKMGSFTEAINATLRNFGWTISFTLEPWTVVVNGRPVQTYSKSEQYRIGVGIQLAVAHLSGVDFAVVDELDMLDAANRGLLTAMLLRAPIGQILVLATRETALPLPPLETGILAYRLAKEGDRSVVVQSNAAPAA